MATYGGSIAQGYVDALNQMEARKSQAANTALARQQFEQNQAATQQAQLQARQQQLAMEQAGQAYGQLTRAPQVPVQGLPPGAGAPMMGPQVPMPGQQSMPARPPMPPQALPNAPGAAAPPVGAQGAPLSPAGPGGMPGAPQVPMQGAPAPAPGAPSGAPPIRPYAAPPTGAPAAPGIPQVPLSGQSTAPGADNAPPGPGDVPPPITNGISLDSMAQTLMQQGASGADLYRALMASMPLLDARGKEQMAMINAQMQGTQLNRQTAADLERARHNRAMEAAEAAKLKQLGGTTSEPLSDDAMQIRAFNRLINGKYPPGMGKDAVADRRGVDNMAAKLAREMGVTPEAVAMLPAQGKSDAGALYKLTQMETGIANAQGAMIKNGHLAVEMAKKLPVGTDFRALNSAILSGSTQFGDVNTSNYALALSAFKREYERAFAGPLSAAMLPVEAMKQGEKLIPPGITPEQLEGAIRTLERDVENVKLSAEEQVANLRMRLRDPIKYYAQGAAPIPGGPPAPAAAPAGAPPGIDQSAIEAELRRRKALK